MFSFVNPWSKGQYEYLGARKKQQMSYTMLCLLTMAVIIGAGLLIYHKKTNLLMIPGLLMALPFSNFFVTWLALADGKELPAEKREALRPYEEAGMCLYHMMYCDEKGRRYYLDAVVCYQGGIVAFSSSSKSERKTDFETDCITRMKKRGVTQRLRIYKDWESFAERLSTVEAAVPEEDVKKVENALELFSQMCL